MKMKINTKILSIPPYISTSWKNITSLHVETRNSQPILVIILVTGSCVEVPHLNETALQEIFQTHANFLNEQQGMPELPTVLQHNPEQANLPDLPPEMLDRIARLSKGGGINDPTTLPVAEPLCNCVYCQMARAINAEYELCALEEPDELIPDSELTFRSWDIKQTAEKLYKVTNPSDDKEEYMVFLGKPVGCTCGQKNCDHIQAVLRS